MSEQIARFKPGSNVPGFADTAVVGGHFVKILGDKTTHGDYKVGHCTAGAQAFGVAEYDSAAATEPATSVERRVNVVRRGAVARVVSGAAVTAGDIVKSDSTGRAVTLSGSSTADATAAALDTGVVGSNNALTYTARDAGFAGNGISVQLKDPAGNSQALSVTVNGNDIVVNLETNGGGAITSTATLVAAAIAASAAANSLVSVANKGASSGAGVVAAVAATNLTGGTDPGEAGSAHALGQALMTCDGADDIIEVDLF